MFLLAVPLMLHSKKSYLCSMYRHQIFLTALACFLPWASWMCRCRDKDGEEVVARAQRRQISLDKYLALPEELPVLSKKERLKGNRKVALNAGEDVAARVGVTKSHRCSHLQR